MKRITMLVVVLLAVIASLAVAKVAKAWHATEVTVSAKCNVGTGVYDVKAEITQSGQWPGAFVKSITPISFTGTTTGSQKVVVVIGWPSTSETQTWTKYVTLDGSCKKVCEPEIRYVDKIVYVDRPAPPAPPPVVTTTTVTNTVTTPAPPPKKVAAPCVAPKNLPKGASVKKGKGCNYYITLKQKVVKSKPKVIHDRCKPPPPPDCVGKCYPPYNTGSG